MGFAIGILYSTLRKLEVAVKLFCREKSCQKFLKSAFLTNEVIRVSVLQHLPFSTLNSTKLKEILSASISFLLPLLIQQLCYDFSINKEWKLD